MFEIHERGISSTALGRKIELMVEVSSERSVSVSDALVHFFFFSSRRRHTRLQGDWSSDVCSSDLMVYSPLDSLKIARNNPDRRVVFMAIGFETTAPSSAMTVLRAKAEGLENFSIFRSEERRVGEEGRSRWSPYHLKKKKKE